MKRHPLLTAAIAGLTTVSATATTYLSDFTGINPGESLNGFNGWTQSSPNETGIEEIEGVPTEVEYPWAFGAKINGRPAGAIGGFYNTDPPASGEFYVSQTLSLSGSLYFKMIFTLVDSDPYDVEGTLYGSERNRFAVGLLNPSGAEIFSLIFEPNIDPENPDPLTNPLDTWNISASSGGIQTTAAMAVLEGGLYTLQLSLAPKGSDMNFGYSLVSALNTQSARGVIEGLTDIEISELRIGMTAIDDGLGEQFGTNFLAFERVDAAIPEPSSLLLVSFTCGAFAFFRKRR